MADKYYRLIGFMINICPEPLRLLFLAEAKAEQGTAYTTLDSYLVFKRPQIAKLIHKNKIRRDQFDLLFPVPGTDPVDVSKWDISLLSMLITEFFGKTLQKNIVSFINEIRDVRNILQHTSSTSSMTDSTFNYTWQRLETATLFLANLQGTACESIIKQKVIDAKCKNMPDLGNTLCQWFEEKITQLESNVAEISQNTKDIQANANEGVSILRSATANKPGRSGEKVKRLKTVDKKLKKMQDFFEWTMNTEIPEDFKTPTETDLIKSKLRDNHLAIVAGQNNSLYLAAALSAVKDMGYNEKRCVEMQTSSDWNRIDPEDVDFVLCCYPFGKDTYDEEKAKGMADIFSRIQHTVKEGDDKKIAVLIVTDIGVLNECTEKHYHDILEEVVTVYHSTSETQPADLTVARCNLNFGPSTSTVSQNLTELTSLFLDHHKAEVRPDILKAAKDTFKVHKSVVLVGPPRSGKTSLAVALAAFYHPSQVLLLVYPEQVQQVDLNRTHLVIIEDFAGKYEHKKTNSCNWYKTFDLLNVMKSAGKLNIIITCDKQRLEKCIEEIAAHPLLEHPVELHCGSVLVKQEIINTIDVDQGQPVNVETGSAQVTAIDVDQRQPVNVETGSAQATAIDVDQRQPVNVETGSAQVTAIDVDQRQPVNVETGSAQATAIDVDQRQPVNVETGSAQATAIDVDQGQPVNVETDSAQVTAEYPDSEGPVNLSVPRYSTCVSMKECINLRSIVGDGSFECTSMCLTKNKSIYVAGIKPSMFLNFAGDPYYLLYHDKNTNNTIKYSVKDRIGKMCCTNAGDIVAGLYNNTFSLSVNILRITDGSLSVMKTIQCRGLGDCIAVSCDDEDHIYMLWNDGTVNIYNINLESIGQYTLSIMWHDYVNVSAISPKGHIFVNSGTKLQYENFRSKSSSESKHKNIYESCICAASEDPYTVFVYNDRSNRLIQYNTKCQIISEIPLTLPYVNISVMVFDETSSRLIVDDEKSEKIYEVYLK